MPPLDLSAASTHRRRRARLLMRTALCSVLCGSALAPVAAFAGPVGGFAEVNAGGGSPTIVQDGRQTTVTLGAQRTVLNWSTFDVKPDETVTFNFGARNWIVLNRIQNLNPTKIEGAVEGKVGSAFGGNVWFSSQNSIIFGKGARVDVGGLLVGIGTVDTAKFLDPANNVFSFNGNDNLPGARVFVLGDANITAHGGSIFFAGPTVATRGNAMISATGGDVLYGAAKTYQIRLAPGSGGDFDLVDFIVSSAKDGADGGVAADLAGDTRASTVFVAAVNRSTLGTAIINLQGMITATAAKAEGGDIVLSGGAGIQNRQLGASLAGVGDHDLYLNRASASRDIQISNVGQTIARPWLRPPEESKDPTTLQEDTEQAECTARGECVEEEDPCPFNFCFAPLEPAVLGQPIVSALFDPTAVSSLTSGRDTRIRATETIELGRVAAGRDVDVSGPQIEANSLIAGGALSAVSTEGDVLLAGAGAMRDSTITAKGAARIDAITTTQKLTVTAGGDIVLGDGTSAATGPISLSAGQNVLVDLASARIESLTAGATADLRGGALDIGTVSAPKVFAQAASVKLGKVTTAGDLYVVATGGDAIVGDATVGDDVFVLANHGTASLGNATLSGAGADIVGREFIGNPDAAGNGRVVQVESADFDARLGLATGGVTGATAVTVRGGRDAIVEVTRETPGTFSVTAARDATLRAPTVKLESVTAGRDLTLGSTTGDFTLTNNLTAVRNITVSAAGALTLGDVRADAGSVSLSGASVKAGAVSASEDLTLKATSGGVTTASYRTGRDLILQGTTISLGSALAPVVRDLSITSLGDFASSAPLSAGRNVTVDVAGKATLGQVSGAGIRIAAGDLDLTGTVTAPVVQIESRGGAIRVGGSAGGSGFVLDGNEFGQIRASTQVKIYAGVTTGGARGDLTLQDLNINTANTPSVSFLVGSGNTARVTGIAAPTTGGGTLRIGDATDLNWRPGSILITGGLGAATFANGDYTNIRAFDEVRLAARQDILMGSQRFITLIQNTAPENIDLARLMPAGVAPVGDELLKVYVSTGRLEVSADNKVVQQNAAPSGTLQSVGLVFTGQASPALIIDPPKVVELWGAFAGRGSGTLSGSQANGALTFTVVDVNGQPTTKPDGANYRFNSCDVGTANCFALPGGMDGGGFGGDMGGLGGVSGGSADSGLRARDALGDEGDLSDDALVDALSSESLTSPPVLLGLAPPSSDEIVTDPVVTGTGSEEIWRKRRQTK